MLGALVLFGIQQEFSNDGSWYLVGLGAVAILVTLIFPRGLWGAVVDRFHIRLVPVGYTLRQVLRAQSDAAARVRTQVAIIGAGPAGLTLALLLAARRYRLGRSSRTEAASMSRAASGPACSSKTPSSCCTSSASAIAWLARGLTTPVCTFAGRGTSSTSTSPPHAAEDHDLRSAGGRQGRDNGAARTGRERAIRGRRRGRARPRLRAAPRHLRGCRRPARARVRFHRRLRRVSRRLPAVGSRRAPAGARARVPLQLARDPRPGATQHRRADLRLARAWLRAALDALAVDQPPVPPGSE